MVDASPGPNHKCRILTTKGPYEFSGCASPNWCNPDSHGDASFVSFCVCGKVRRWSCRSQAVESGPWEPARPGEKR